MSLQDGLKWCTYMPKGCRVSFSYKRKYLCLDNVTGTLITPNIYLLVICLGNEVLLSLHRYDLVTMITIRDTISCILSEEKNILAFCHKIFICLTIVQCIIGISASSL